MSSSGHQDNLHACGTCKLFCPKNSTFFSFSGFQGVILFLSLADVGHHLDEFGLLHLEDAALVEERRQDHFHILQCSEQPTHTFLQRIMQLKHWWGLETLPMLSAMY